MSARQQQRIRPRRDRRSTADSVEESDVKIPARSTAASTAADRLLARIEELLG